MYTIKIVIYEFINDVRMIKKTLYVEGSDIQVRRTIGKEGESTEKLALRAAQEMGNLQVWHVNPCDDSSEVLILSYFDKNNEKHHMLLFFRSDIYILQNGKTVDSIKV